MADGTYTITQIVTNSCGSDTTTQTITVIVTNEQITMLNSQIKIYPNPFNQKISILSHSEIKSVSFTDVLGKQLDVKINLINPIAIGSKNIIISTENIVQGIYFIRIETSTGKFTHKIIKE